jgi:hypothetical protein
MCCGGMEIYADGWFGSGPGNRPDLHCYHSA